MSTINHHSQTPNLPRIFLIRHGETQWSLTGQHTGQTDISLTPHGETEARQLACLLTNISFSQVLCSPLKRARQTCMAAGLGENPLTVPELAEWDYGDYEGQRSADIHQQLPDWNVYQDGCPRGESPEQISARADKLIARLRQSEGNIALFTHGQIGSAIAARWIGLAIINAQHLSLSTASLSILSFDPHHPSVPIIALWNATALSITP
ncbi:histidine phosphatase family protein [Ferrovum myxofaciens]|jgi:probable phosphoglycerate mutase|uniref:Alpha-ribazole phosphatase n=1 Tax=Ferrovum myxofaciens TaxID=416213 RepID=A0A8F3IKV4_9PROT|nr:histidine phosphatase family protein [Ferrovum myxofaciens]KXW57283.1 alpha-ribazole phosphatase [Ferrovum myxofaciens]MBU6993816.1 histidine phosphatase family protein [Ferrovum myxofaciens]QKE37794.1 MAG: histidine phosphatase family protein [Ferrovum myxofaciens]QWY75461.1 MAG: histidine phosphatase family protein [Ferrovum myxofaciens]QWY78201.1 MAG: histidine phosphatase family protein [Ferrovum myxofaciens]